MEIALRENKPPPPPRRARFGLYLRSTLCSLYNGPLSLFTKVAITSFNTP